MSRYKVGIAHRFLGEFGLIPKKGCALRTNQLDLVPKLYLGTPLAAKLRFDLVPKLYLGTQGVARLCLVKLKTEFR